MISSMVVFAALWRSLLNCDCYSGVSLVREVADPPQLAGSYSKRSRARLTQICVCQFSAHEIRFACLDHADTENTQAHSARAHSGFVLGPFTLLWATLVNLQIANLCQMLKLCQMERYVNAEEEKR